MVGIAESSLEMAMSINMGHLWRQYPSGAGQSSLRHVFKLQVCGNVIRNESESLASFRRLLCSPSCGATNNNSFVRQPEALILWCQVGWIFRCKASIHTLQEFKWAAGRYPLPIQSVYPEKIELLSINGCKEAFIGHGFYSHIVCFASTHFGGAVYPWFVAYTYYSNVVKHGITW